jgi:hypothetical protein
LKNPFFIFGTQRSGTTILARILSAHPNVFVQNELSIKLIFKNNVSAHEMIVEMKRQIGDRRKISFSTFMKNNGKDVWGYKEPRLSWYKDDLLKFLPEHKFIIILRDPRAVTNSYIENRWGLGTNVYSGAHRWKSEVTSQQQLILDFPDNFLPIKFEDLISDSQCVVNKVCAFLSIKFESSMLNYFDQKSFYKEQKENANTNSKLDKGIVTKWKSKFSIRKINIIETICSDLMDDFNYEKVGEKIEMSSMERNYYLLHQSIIGEIQMIYQYRKGKLVDWLDTINT